MKLVFGDIDFAELRERCGDYAESRITAVRQRDSRTSAIQDILIAGSSPDHSYGDIPEMVRLRSVLEVDEKGFV